MLVVITLSREENIQLLFDYLEGKRLNSLELDLLEIFLVQTLDMVRKEN
jgi:hypothetical protein